MKYDEDDMIYCIVWTVITLVVFGALAIFYPIPMWVSLGGGILTLIFIWFMYWLKTE